MKKRILSILLAVALLLSVGVVPARAADSCVSVKADAATTAEVVAGDLLEIPLGDIFRDSDGHSLTYTLVNAAQFGTQTKVGGSTLYVSEKDPGTYEPKIKATCSGGKSVTATLTVTVKPAPHGLDAQYNYDESPAKEVTVYVTISNDGVDDLGENTVSAVELPVLRIGRRTKNAQKSNGAAAWPGTSGRCHHSRHGNGRGGRGRQLRVRCHERQQYHRGTNQNPL